MPNPATNQVTIYYQIQKENNILRIYDNVGRVVKSIKLDPNGNSQTIDISGYVNGSYSVKLIEENSIVFEDKLIILK